MDISTLNNICPVVSHSHRTANNREIRQIRILNPDLFDDKNLCLICKPVKEKKLLYSILCSNYIGNYKVTLEQESIYTAKRIFIEIFKIPIEIVEIILKYTEEHHTRNLLVKSLNNDSFNHMIYCKFCAPKLLEFVSVNICPTHMMSRLSIRKGKIYD